MIDIKRSIIIEEGTSVIISHIEQSEDQWVNTEALVGRATKQFASDISLESYRQLQVIPEIEVSNGYNVHNVISGEDYLVVSKYLEVIYNEASAVVIRAVVCNSKLYVGRMNETADRFGNITKKFEDVYSEIPVYIEKDGSKVTKGDPGEYMDTEYTVFAPEIDITDKDRIYILERGKKVPFKLKGKDYSTFQGLVELKLETETRRDV